MKPHVCLVSVTLISGGALATATLDARPLPFASSPVETQFRGCDDTRTCRFALDPTAPGGGDIQRVIPEGVRWTDVDEATARAVRDRLNALMSSMIHQHKRVELFGLRLREDGAYVARITVNGADVSQDPILAEIGSGRSAIER